MNRYAFLLVPFLAAASQLVAGTVTSVTVKAWSSPDLPPSCSLTSTGAAITCGANSQGLPIANAFGLASASLGSLSLYGSVSTVGVGEGYAAATAQYDYQVTLPGAASGMITGKYSLRGSSTTDQNFFYLNWGLTIGQGGSTLLFPPSPDKFVFADTVTLSTPFIAGQALKITGFASGGAGILNGTFGDYVTDVSLQLIGFYDEAGKQLAFAEVPEPVLWPVLFMSFVAMYTRLGDPTPK
jgi:hypothetical protein